MTTKLSRFLIRLIQRFLIRMPTAKNSYSQSGEDLIVRFIFDQIGILTPSYIDIGAHHPYLLSNTAIFHLNGSRGINIEPNDDLFPLFLMERKGDINLNNGVSVIAEELDYYKLSDPGLNTFSEEEANNYVNQHGHKIVSIEKKTTTTISDIIDQHCNGIFPDFLSLDVEGLDFELLKSIDFSKSAPIIICIETSTHSTTGHVQKIQPIIDYLIDQDYFLYADTNINTIFVKRNKWFR
jgi:FkbM family methyltransferase